MKVDENMEKLVVGERYWLAGLSITMGARIRKYPDSLTPDGPLEIEILEKKDLDDSGTRIAVTYREVLSDRKFSYTLFNSRRANEVYKNDMIVPVHGGGIFESEGDATDYWNSTLRNLMDQILSVSGKKIKYLEKRLREGDR